METTTVTVLDNTSVLTSFDTTVSNWSNVSGYSYYYTAEHPYLEKDSLTNFYLYCMPVIVCIGVLGNALSFYAVTKAPLKSTSISVYVSVYNVSNIVTLIFNAGLDWCFETLNMNHFKTYSEVSCRIWEFVLRMMTFSGIWFVVCLTIDRYIAMWHPHHAQGMCNPFMAKIAVVCTFTGLTVVSCHSLWFYQLRDGWCYLDIAMDVNKVWQWFSGMLYSLVPLLIIFFFGNSLIVRLCLKHRGNLLPDSSEVDMDLTQFVMILSVLYFIFNFPATIITFIRPAWQHDYSVVVNLDRALMVTGYIAMINHVWPFFVLLGCSKAFRTTLSNMPENISDSCWKFVRRRSVNTELMSVEDNYVPVSNSSTSV